MHQAAADGAAIARLPVTNPAQSLRHQRQLRAQRWFQVPCRTIGSIRAIRRVECVFERALTYPCANHYGAAGWCDLLEFSDPVNVDQPRRAHQTHRHHRHQALAARQQLGITAVLRQQFERVM